MGHRCCSKQKVKKGLWSPEEDEKLLKHITSNGHGSWSSVPKLAGLQRCGKSCRLRWINYLRPDLRRGTFTEEEEQIIIDVHRILGNRWAQIAKHLPGRTDNEVKNFWNSCIKKKLISQGLDPKTHNLIPSHQRPKNTSSLNNNNIPVFTLTSQMTSNVPLETIKPPLLPLPNYDDQPTTFIQPQLPSSSHYQNPNNISWNNANNSNNFNVNISSSGYGVSLLDENNYSMWGANSSVVEQQFGSNGNKECEMQQQPMLDSCFDDSSSFDFELMESTLMSAAMDDFAWNF